MVEGEELSTWFYDFFHVVWIMVEAAWFKMNNGCSHVNFSTIQFNKPRGFMIVFEPRGFLNLLTTCFLLLGMAVSRNILRFSIPTTRPIRRPRVFWLSGLL